MSILEFSLYVGISFRFSGSSIVAIDGSSKDPRTDPWKLLSFKKCGSSFEDLVVSVDKLGSLLGASSKGQRYIVYTKTFASDPAIDKGLPLRLTEMNRSYEIEDEKPFEKPVHSTLLTYCKNAINDGFLERSSSPEMKELELSLERVQFTQEGQLIVSDEDTSPAEAFLLALGSRFTEWIEAPSPALPWFCRT